MDKHPTIMIFEDHPIVAQGISDLVKSELGVDCTLVKVRDSLPKTENCICIIDLELGETTGLNLIEHLKNSGSKSKILVYTMHEEPWIKASLMALNIDGAVSKNEPVRTLIEAVKSLLADKKFFSPAFTLETDENKLPYRLIEMSEREKQVVLLLCQGLTSELIAKRLNISVNTVNTYRRRALDKFNASNVAELVYRTKGLI